MGGGLESSCVGRVYGADGAVYGIMLHQVGISLYFISERQKFFQDFSVNSATYNFWNRNSAIE